MKLRKQILRASIVLSVGILSGCSLSAESGTVTGYVQASRLDEDDNPREVFLFDGSTEYEISGSDKHGELLDYVDRKVSATGLISEGKPGKKYIEIENFKVLD